METSIRIITLEQAVKTHKVLPVGTQNGNTQKRARVIYPCTMEALSTKLGGPMDYLRILGVVSILGTLGFVGSIGRETKHRLAEGAHPMVGVGGLFPVCQDPYKSR